MVALVQYDHYVLNTLMHEVDTEVSADFCSPLAPLHQSLKVSGCPGEIDMVPSESGIG